MQMVGGGILALIFSGGCQTSELTSARVHIRQNDWDNAVVALEKIVAAHPQNAEAQFLLGQGYGVQGRFRNMNRAFAAVLMTAPQFEAEIKTWRQKYFAEYFNAGVKAMRENNFVAARDAFAVAAVIDPQQKETNRNLAYVYERAGEFEKAFALYQEALANNSADWEAALAVSNLYNQRQEYEKSATTLEQALRKNPEQPQVLAALAGVYDCLGKSEDALAAYRQALQSEPEDQVLLLNLARLHLNQSDYANALQQYGKVLGLDSENFEANYNAGIIYLKLGERAQKTGRDLEKQAPAGSEKKARTAAPRDSSRTLQFHQEAARNFKTSVPFLQKAVKLDSLHAGAYFILGVGFMRLGEITKAQEAFKRCEQLQEKSSQADKLK
jgi:tetratricopeptide (TPR) repeat protein